MSWHRMALIPLILHLTATVARADRVDLFVSDREAGTAGSALPELRGPFGVACDRQGTVYIADMTGHRIWKKPRDGAFSAYAGTGNAGDAGDGGPAVSAKLNGPHNLAVTPEGDLFIADTWNQKIRKVDARTGVITTLAGTGRKGFRGDGEDAARAEFGGIYCVTLSPDLKTLHLADLDNRRIRAIDLRTNIVSTVAGNGQKGIPRDGDLATQSPLVDPRAVASDADDNIYILERGGHALRVVDRSGRIRTVVGTGKAGFCSGTIAGREAKLNGPKHLACETNGCVLIADTENHALLRYDPRSGRVSCIAGSGSKGSKGIGDKLASLQLNQPHGVTWHDGSLWISDSSNRRVLMHRP